MSETFGYVGDLDMRSFASDLDLQLFLISQRLSRIATVQIVKVIAVHAPTEPGPIGTVDVQPAVNQIDGQGNPTPHSTIYGLPYARIQGGTNAVIIDPVMGDFGLAGFCSSDISKVAATGQVSNPGSRRRFSWSDGVYLMGLPFQTTPTRWVKIDASGVTIVDPGNIVLQAPTVTIDGNVTVNGAITASGQITGSGVALSTHVHSGVTTGSGDTGPPV